MTPIDLDAAVEMALENGADAQAARWAVESAELALRARRAAHTPDLTVRLSATESLGRTFSEELGTNVTEPSGVATARVVSTLPLWAGGELRGRREAAEASLAGRRATAAQTRQDLTLTLAGLLLDTAEARGTLAVREATLAAEEALRGQVVAFVEAGARTRADQLQQEAAVSRAEADLVEARRTIAQAELSLVEVLRLDPEGAWTFTPPEGGPVPSASLADLVAQAVDARPELDAYEAAVAAATAEVHAARAGRRPSLDLSVGAATSVVSQDASPVSTQLQDQAAAWAAVDLDVPVFDRGITRNAVGQAGLAERAARLDLETAREALAVQVRGVLLDRESVEAGLVAAERRRDAAVAAEAILRDRYEAGASPLFELLSARAEVADAEHELLVARTAVVRAGYTLAWTVGAL